MSAISKTPEVLSSEILIKSVGYSGWFILLEGDFDQRFWEPRLSGSCIRVVNCVGRPNVLGALELLAAESRASNVVALADKDYDELTGRLVQNPRLAYTDDNDLEVSLLRVRSEGLDLVIERLLRESVDVNKIQRFEAERGVSVVECIREMAVAFGVLRFLNDREGCGVNFDGLPVRHAGYFDFDLFQLNKPALWDHFIALVNLSGRVRLSVADLDAEVALNRACDRLSDWSLVRGHDLMQVLSAAINSQLLRASHGHRQASEASLARDLCLMVHQVDLARTAMYQKLDNWGDEVGVSFFR